METKNRCTYDASSLHAAGIDVERAQKLVERFLLYPEMYRNVLTPIIYNLIVYVRDEEDDLDGRVVWYYLLIQNNMLREHDISLLSLRDYF